MVNGFVRRVPKPGGLVAVVCSSLTLFLINELLCHDLYSWTWPRLDISHSLSANQLRVLFVADPQLIGLHDVAKSHGSLSLAILDADRYLSISFRLACNHVQPHVVVFLGDIFNEGSEATDEEFAGYVTRFHQIFTLPKSVKPIYIEGDNDVGGEMEDFRLPFKVKRFHKYFRKTMDSESEGLVNAKFVDFMSFNYIFGDVVDKRLRKRITFLTSQARAPYRILLNHMQLLTRAKMEFLPLVRQTKANLIFTADLHKAKLYSCEDCQEEMEVNAPRTNNRQQGSPIRHGDVLTFDLRDTSFLYEVVVPTCSYRNGVFKMGYGAATITDSGIVHYAVLNLPPRYYFLIAYAVIAVVVVVSAVACGHRCGYYCRQAVWTFLRCKT